VFFWCPFLTTSLATLDLTIGVHLERVTTRAPDKVDVPNLAFDLKYTLTFKWYMVGYNVRMDTKKDFVLKRDWTMCLNFVNYCRHNSQYDGVT
jgi:hypothetical protein